MRRSNERILTTHPGRLPDPDGRPAVMAARSAGDERRFAELARDGIAAIVQRQVAIGIDVMSDGEFWKAHDRQYYESRAAGVTRRPLKPGERGSLSAQQSERRSPEFKQFWEIYDLTGNTPLPGAEFRGRSLERERYVISSQLSPKPPDAIKREIGLVKSGIAKAGAKVEDFFFPVLGPGWMSHSVFNDFYKTDEEYVHAMALFYKADYKAVVDAGFTLQIDDPDLCDSFGMMDPPLSIEEYRKRAQLHIEALNWALEGIPEDRVRYHTCWGSWHTPHTTDIPFEHVIDILLTVKAGAYSVEAADVRHELDWKLWEGGRYRLPEGKIYIPGVIAHKTTTVEPAELVAERIVRYANLMGRENVIAGVDCGVGGRCYPDIGWAKLKALSDGAALATKTLWS
jgi:5-methyltetrahydropteroyltriglutamate--homocysteine methyltransferase